MGEPPGIRYEGDLKEECGMWERAKMEISELLEVRRRLEREPEQIRVAKSTFPDTDTFGQVFLRHYTISQVQFFSHDNREN